MEWIYRIEEVGGRGKGESLWDGVGIEFRGEFDFLGGLGSQVGGLRWVDGSSRGWLVVGLAGLAGGGRLTIGEAWGVSSPVARICVRGGGC